MYVLIIMLHAGNIISGISVYMYVSDNAFTKTWV